MDENELDYKTLRRFEEKEKKTPTLTKIDPFFYEKVRGYIKILKNKAEKEENPQKNKLYQDEIHNMQKIATHIYEHREKKIMHAALSKTRGAQPDLKNILEIEEILYAALVNQINQSRINILENKSSQLDMNIEETTTECIKTSEKKSNSNPIVQVLHDVPEFIGTDSKTYHLRQNDILSMSEEMSTLLEARKVVKKIQS